MRTTSRMIGTVAVAAALIGGYLLTTPDSQRFVLEIEDALFVILDITGPVLGVEDVNGDGVGDLLAQRRCRGESSTFELLSGVDGSLIRVLLEIPESEAAGPRLTPTFHWDTGFDANGDGVSDLLIARPDLADDRGIGSLVQVLSGRDGRMLIEVQVGEAYHEPSFRVAFLGDITGDGCDEFLIGEPQRLQRSLIENGPMIIGGRDDGATSYVRFEGGSTLERDAYYQGRLDNCSDLPGLVSLRSGKDGRELWRLSGLKNGHAFGDRVHRMEDCDGDGLPDVLVQCDVVSKSSILLVSGATGEQIAAIASAGGAAGPMGDFDGDGAQDIFVDEGVPEAFPREGGTRIFSSASEQQLAYFPYPALSDEFGNTVGLGDLDHDGYSDFALGEPNFNYKARGSSLASYFERDISKMSLDAALDIPSQPRVSGSASGVVLVYSGRTGEVLFGIWGSRGTFDGLGFQTRATSDLDGDGFADLVVTGARNEAFVFRNPLGAAGARTP